MPVSLKSQRRPASLKGAMSVSFAAADDEMKSRAKESGKESPASRGIFSTRSLRMAAARLAEASPRLRRRAKTQVSVDEKQEKSPKNKGKALPVKFLNTELFQVCILEHFLIEFSKIRTKSWRVIWKICSLTFLCFFVFNIVRRSDPIFGY